MMLTRFAGVSIPVNMSVDSPHFVAPVAVAQVFTVVEPLLNLSVLVANNVPGTTLVNFVVEVVQRNDSSTDVAVIANTSGSHERILIVNFTFLCR